MTEDQDELERVASSFSTATSDSNMWFVGDWQLLRKLGEGAFGVVAEVRRSGDASCKYCVDIIQRVQTKKMKETKKT